jgi:uncharacterized protein (DUF1697 family)
VRHIALLRGINVGGHNVIKMADLRAMFEAAGATNVETYIQSGNVVFSHEKPSVGTLQAHILAATGFAVPVILRTREQLDVLVGANPFVAKHTHVMFLPKLVGEDALADVKSIKPDKFVHDGLHVYLSLPDGIGRSKLAGAIMKKLPDATARNWETVKQLHAMAIESGE